MDHPDITRTLATGYPHPEQPCRWVVRVSIWLADTSDAEEVAARVKGELEDVYDRVRVDEVDPE